MPNLDLEHLTGKVVWVSRRSKLTKIVGEEDAYSTRIRGVGGTLLVETTLRIEYIACALNVRGTSPLYPGPSKFLLPHSTPNDPRLLQPNGSFGLQDFIRS